MDFIALGSFIYPIINDAISYLNKSHFEVDEKVVTIDYIEYTGLKEKFEHNGYNLRWVAPRNVARFSFQKRYQYVYEINEENKKAFKLIVRNSTGHVDLTLMFKSKTEAFSSGSRKHFPVDTSVNPNLSWFSYLKIKIEVFFKKLKK
ncbi:MAG: hypothetical protein ACK4PR_01865 [Gammaproteobacteria bacterium]